MGTSTPATFVQKMYRMADEVEAIPRAGVAAAAQVVKRSVLAQAPARLRNVGKRGARLNVVYDIQGTTNPIALVRATGPWQIIERDTKPHDIPKQGRRNQKALSIPGIGVVASAHHPGTHGKHPWDKGLAVALPLITKEFEAGLEKGLRRVFR